MRTWFVGALLLGVFAASTAEAQRVEIGIRLGGGAVDVSGYYSTSHYLPPVRYVRPARAARQYCEAEGRFLYCWDATPYWDGRPTVVRVSGVHPAHLERHHKRALRAHRNWLRQQRTHARRGRDVRYGKIIVVLGR